MRGDRKDRIEEEEDQTRVRSGFVIGKDPRDRSSTGVVPPISVEAKYFKAKESQKVSSTGTRFQGKSFINHFWKVWFPRWTHSICRLPLARASLQEKHWHCDTSVTQPSTRYTLHALRCLPFMAVFFMLIDFFLSLKL